MMPGSVRRGAGGQDNDWEPAARSRLPPGEMRRTRRDQRPQLLSVSVAGDPRVNVVLPITDPDVGLARRLEVQEPLRDCPGAAHPRSHDQVVTVVIKIGDRAVCGVPLLRPGTVSSNSGSR